jgi:hypothetical protein
VAEHRVVVEAQLAVEGDQAAVLGDDERVDLDQRAVQLHVELAQRPHELFGAGDARARDVQLVADLANLVGQQAHVRIEMFLVDQVRRFGRHLFDLHAALARDHQHRLGRRPVEDDAQIQLAGDLAALFDEHPVDRLAFRSGLNRHQLLAQQILGNGQCFLGRADQLHAPLLRVAFDRPLPAAAGVNLGLHHRQWPAQLFECRRRLFRLGRHLPLEHSDARLAEQFFGLIFVDFHRDLP